MSKAASAPSGLNAVGSFQAVESGLSSREERRSFIVLYHGIPHDIGPFISDHPGGPDVLLGISEGTEISDIMDDESIHSHSSHSLSLLANMRVSDTNESKDQSFFDFSRPLVWQLLSPDSTISKEMYLKAIHKTHFFPTSVRLFENEYLEMLSKTPWWVVPLVWIPTAIFLFAHGHSLSFPKSIVSSVAITYSGVLFWSLVEYIIHRFLFHVDSTCLLPDNRYMLTAHFFLHGIHHFMPMDLYRLVMPPAMTAIIGFFVWLFCSMLIRGSVKWLFFAGLLLGYVRYDLTHYNLHHKNNTILMQILGSQDYLRKKHNIHHYKNSNTGFGVSSYIWDVVFGTLQ